MFNVKKMLFKNEFDWENLIGDMCIVVWIKIFKNI